MVKVSFRLIPELGNVELHLEKPQPFSWVLTNYSRNAGLEIGAVIAIRAGKVMALDELVYDDDTVEVFPALAGG